MEFLVKNSQNERVLNKVWEKEAKRQELLIKNATGIDIDITTLTTVLAEVREQKFYTVKPSDFMPFRVGTGAWSTSLTSFTSEHSVDDFATGFTKTSTKHGRIPNADVGIQPITSKIATWNKQIDWTIPELQFAQKFNNWDLIAAKETARKTNWDLGIQKISFLGESDEDLGGLLTQSAVTPNAGVIINKPISTMTAAEISALPGLLLKDYFSNSGSTVLPDRFVVPMTDWLGMTSPTDATFAIKSKMDYLMEAFQKATGNSDFKILPVAYASAANSGGLLTKDRYALYRYDQDSLRSELPVDYTMTMANTFNGYQYANVGYGQIGGVVLYRPKEMSYYDLP